MSLFGVTEWVGMVFILMMIPGGLYASQSTDIDVYYKDCIKVLNSTENAKRTLTYRSVRALSQQILFQLEFRDSYQNSRELKEWRASNEYVLATSYKEYIDTLSSGTLKGFNIRFKSGLKGYLCAESAATGDREEFKKRIYEIKKQENNLPLPEYVDRFFELPQYHRLEVNDE